ncbi:hypothetical protein GCM10009786_03430 [Leucobacter alluvii]|uniref:Nucleotidyltransferase n=1 Tax=Leucobacter alluvii TaxID=340321 RepID=A0ABP5MUH4_9MICO|nr:hypothetical protein [Leucobacter sp. L43]
MFESVIGPKMPLHDDTVVVWMVDGRPARLVFERARWRVEGEPRPIVEVPDEHIHPLITHVAERHTGWRCTVRRDGGAERVELAVRRDGVRWIAERLAR